MILSLILITITATAFTATIAINPISIGLLILFLALMLAILFSLTISSWVSFLIFLIYIGGILVIFSYFVAIIPNQTLPIIIISITILISTSFFIITSLFLGISPTISISFFKQTNIIYTEYNIPTLIILALILLFTIILVVKISIHNKGPLRPFLYV